MADPKKISELSAVTVIDKAADTLEVDDTSEADAAANKKITPDQIVSGKRAIWVPVQAMNPSLTAGCGGLTTTETTAGRPDMKTRPFDSATEEHAQFSVAFPLSWDLGTVTFMPYWTKLTAPTAGLDGVAWGLQGLAVGDDELFDQAYGTEIVVGVDAVKVIEDLWIGAESTAVTIAGTPANDDLCEFQISRVVASADPLDDMDVDAELIGVKIFYTTDIADD